MALKIFKAFWFLSVMALLASLLYNYAGWREELVIQETVSEETIIGKEELFYGLMATFALVNVLVYVIGKMFPSNEDFRAWFHGLIMTVNMFFIIAMSFVGTYNSGENFDFSRIEFILYGSIFLVIGWAVAWPFYALFQKFFLKETV